jgi:hypothetical protein
MIARALAIACVAAAMPANAFPVKQITCVDPHAMDCPSVQCHVL